MLKPQVQIVDESISSSARGLVTGVVYFDFGPFQFPESNWNDAVVVVLGWWLSALIDLLKVDASEVELRFMEGPPWISIRGAAGELHAMRCLEGPGGRVQYECEGPALDLLKSVLAVAARVQEICKQRGWQSADIDALEARARVARTLTG